MKMDTTVKNIAKKVLRIETLETRRRDSLDFHDCAVWNIKEALEKAYRAGMKDTSNRTSIYRVCCGKSDMRVKAFSPARAALMGIKKEREENGKTKIAGVFGEDGQTFIGYFKRSGTRAMRTNELPKE
jgi:hypothetical protein